MREARYHTMAADGVAHCGLCGHGCAVAPGERGLCRVRENRDGRLYSLVYGLVAAEAADPVEKKPLHHFRPGSRTWSIATMGCNFRCRHCQNHSLSQLGSWRAPAGVARTPDQVVAMALAAGCDSISCTYSEPTIFFEFTEDVGRAAKAAGLANILVSNGFMSAAAKSAAEWLDAANIDIKAFTEEFYRDVCGARLAPVLDTVRRLFDLGVWLEVTTLLIPGHNDDEAELANLARFLVGISPDIPWHLSAFHPAYRLTDAPPTPPETLLRAREIGRAAGLRHIYIGNMLLPGAGDTICPKCGKVVLMRQRFRAAGGKGGACPACGTKIAGRWG